MTHAFKNLLLVTAVTTLSVPAFAHDSTRHDAYSDHTHTERNMMDDGARTAGREGLYRGNNEERYNTNRRYNEYYIDNRNEVNARYRGGNRNIHTNTAFDTEIESSLTPNQVRIVQRQLNKNGYRVGVDGKIGPQTRSAIRSYQRDNNMQATGKLDSNTLISMRDGDISYIEPAAGASTRSYGALSYDQALFVQSRLKNRGYMTPTNGRIDANTRSSISEFQSRNGLVVTGDVNVQTLNALGIHVQ